MFLFRFLFAACYTIGSCTSMSLAANQSVPDVVLVASDAVVVDDTTDLLVDDFFKFFCFRPSICGLQG